MLSVIGKLGNFKFGDLKKFTKINQQIKNLTRVYRTRFTLKLSVNTISIGRTVEMHLVHH